MNRGLLNGTVKLIMLQFGLSNTKVLPPGLFEKNKETIDELIARKSNIRGTQFLNPTENVSVLQFLEDLANAGYFMVDAFYQARTNPVGKEYLTIKFVFVSEDNIRPGGKFTDHKEDAEKALFQLCESAMWRTRGFLNPFFQDGKMVNGQHAISINLEARSPLVDSEGNAILRWQKDEKGESVGDGPIPIEPKLFLHIENDDINVRGLA